ncbi:GNAT family N-acetyltransferase [Plebeiibacterium marinum]|uniref:GNAT family N-acetyltransferase n=1 Tax=Plebeiibacterium marinum TaxID=2992111 RepID=A0AAE3MBZ0_9BACT|nr:GNAT family N-acetyltransferase [Plebeiobacterium marinum]MCW3804347.1 GNAT family N-acetyltransferase [Plebeiobacterium marinum]
MIKDFYIDIAKEEHLKYVDEILDTIAEAAKIRGTGIAKRSPGYIIQKINEGKAIIALDNGKFAGFCYIESWGHNKFVANSGLIVSDAYRGKGLAKAIKSRAFQLSRVRFPDAKLFGLTTGLAVMKINSELGYKPVTFSELTDDEMFWKGCQSCVNYDILVRTNRRHCLCTGMLYDPDKSNKDSEEDKSLKVYSRWLKFKQSVFLKVKKKDANKNSFLKRLHVKLIS